MKKLSNYLNSDWSTRLQVIWRIREKEKQKTFKEVAKFVDDIIKTNGLLSIKSEDGVKILDGFKCAKYDKLRFQKGIK